MTPARIIYVGEVHDNLEDHRVQLEILQAMNERFPGKVAVGMEMFRRPAQPQLNQWLEGTLSDKDFRKLWIENWGMEMGYYQELLNFIKENKIPLVALNAPQDWEVESRNEGDRCPLSRRAKSASPDRPERSVSPARRCRRFSKDMVRWASRTAKDSPLSTIRCFSGMRRWRRASPVTSHLA
ncbi:MAG: ChaN family lipoprotein [Candidatus Manganitrophus sp.]|nr:ChaN family lipoprotein [Candidatus Manganitrophus sp.]